MKQHITPEQLNDLSDSGKAKLREWWKPVSGDRIIRRVGAIEVSEYALEYELFNKEEGVYAGWVFSQWNVAPYDQVWKVQEYKNKCLPLLSIGQMIEYLDKHNCDVHTCRELPGEARYIRKKHFGYTEVWSKPKDFCDALWEAVKEVLEK